MLYLCTKKINQSFLILREKQAVRYDHSILGMPGLLPVTPTINTAKPEIALSQQLLGRFRSSFQELKPYPYAS